MAEFDVSFGDDILELRRSLEELRERFDGSDTWYVGTAVEYSVYLEFGTSKMDPKPFFRPVLAEADVLGVEAFIKRYTSVGDGDIDSIEELVKTLAFALERAVKQKISQKGLIETGTLRASVRAVRVPGDLPTADEIDPDVSADMEVSA